MTRTNSKYTRVYVNGYDISGTANNIGTVGVNMDAPSIAAYTDAVMNTVLGQASMVCGPVNTFLAPAATGSDAYELGYAGNTVFNVMIPFGILAEPAVGNPMFAWTMYQGAYQATGEGVVAATLDFKNAAYSTIKGYESPFGLLVHAKGAETAANTAVATIDAGAATSKGGIFVYQLFSSDGTCTLSIDDGAANTGDGDFSALSGATSGSITAAVTPKSGMVALATTAAVRRYIRWQIAFGTANTATFALGFIRGY